MKRIWIYMVMVIALAGPAIAADYTVSTSTEQETTRTFWSTELSLSSAATVQEICNAGFARYDVQRLELIRGRMENVFNQMDPADQAAMCAIYATYGISCPGM